MFFQFLKQDDSPTPLRFRFPEYYLIPLHPDSMGKATFRNVQVLGSVILTDDVAFLQFILEEL